MSSEDLLGPDIVEPFHRDGIPEPQMRCLMGDKIRARELLHICRGLSEEHPCFIEEDGARVLHAPELKARHDDAVVFGKGHRDARVFFHPVQGAVDLPENLGQLFLLCGIGFPVKDVDGLSFAVEISDVPPSRREGEEIGRQKDAFLEADVLPPGREAFFLHRTVGDGHPFFGDIQCKGEPCLQVGLVEAGKQRPGPVGDQERIQELRSAVERSVIRRDGNGHLVHPLL